MANRTLAIGDVHGCHRALLTLVGMVDRGPNSKAVIDDVISLRDSCNVVTLSGNHEEMMKNAISGQGLFNVWVDAGGSATLESYGGQIENIPPEHIRFIMSGSPFYETETEIFVHANLEFDISMPNQNAEFLRWKHLGGSERPHVSGKRVVCGHTAQRDGVPLIYDGWVCIDTFPYGGKWLSCLDVDSDHVYQANEKGEVREFPLSRYA